MVLLLNIQVGRNAAFNTVVTDTFLQARLFIIGSDFVLFHFYPFHTDGSALSTAGQIELTLQVVTAVLYTENCVIQPQNKFSAVSWTINVSPST